MKKSLKEYRKSELKSFLFSNLLILLLTSNIVSTLENGIENFDKKIILTLIVNIIIPSTAIYVFTFIFDSIIPSWIKDKLVFSYLPKPGDTIFTDLKRKNNDDRFTTDDVEHYYKDIYNRIDKNPKYKEKQNSLWYEIYHKHRDHPIVFGSNRDFLLLRDLLTQLCVLFIVILGFQIILGIELISNKYCIYSVLMFIILKFSAQIQGKRAVYNVLSVDINERKKHKEGDDNDKENLQSPKG